MRVMDFVLIGILIICLLAMGWLGNDIYEDWNYEKQYNGLHIQYSTYEEAKDISYERDKFGNWVCINVRDMDFEDVVDTCIHEASHEVFARYCEDKEEQCFNIVEEIKNANE